MKAPLSLLLLLPVAACIGPHIVTGTAPGGPAATFSCVTQAVRSLGYSITTSQPATGFLRAEKRDLSSPDSAEYSELEVAVYTDRDGRTWYMITPGRSRRTVSAADDAGPVYVLDSDNQAADSLGRMCGKNR